MVLKGYRVLVFKGFRALVRKPSSVTQVEAFAVAQLDRLAEPQMPEAATAAAGGTAAGDGPQDMETETAPGSEEEAAGAAPVSAAEALRLCSLYCALCIKRHRLLRRLLETYGKAAAPAR